MRQPQALGRLIGQLLLVAVDVTVRTHVPAQFEAAVVVLVDPKQNQPSGSLPVDGNLDLRRGLPPGPGLAQQQSRSPYSGQRSTRNGSSLNGFCRPDETVVIGVVPSTAGVVQLAVAERDAAAINILL